MTPQPTNPALANAYANTNGAVAFLDETFHARGPDRFYVVTAVLVERTEMQLLRDELRDLAYGTYWHTTDQLLTEQGRKQAIAMLELLGDGDEICVIAHHTRVDATDTDLELARRDCLRAMATNLSAGAAPLRGPTSLVVLEERNPRNRSNFDRKHFADMRTQGLIGRSTQVIMTSPKFEHLLWMPDLVSLAYRRTFTHNDDELFTPIRNNVHFTAPPGECPQK